MPSYMGICRKKSICAPPPPQQGYHKSKPSQVCKLNHSLYGLKQASREWNQDFSKALIVYGFKQSEHDHCLFIMSSHDNFLALVVYVNDVLITSNSQANIDALKQHLDVAFTIKDLGSVHYFLGVEVSRSSIGTYLSQRKYILDMLTEVGLTGAKPVDVPLPQGTNFTNDAGAPLSDPEQYR